MGMYRPFQGMKWPVRHLGSGIQPTFHQLPLLKATPCSSLHRRFPAPVNVWTHCPKNNIDICPNLLALQRQSKNRKTRYEIHFMVNTLDPCSNLCIANSKHYKAGESTRCTYVVFSASTRTRVPSIEPTGNKREGGWERSVSPILRAWVQSLGST